MIAPRFASHRPPNVQLGPGKIALLERQSLRSIARRRAITAVYRRACAAR
jgi:hypothetical protein